MELLAESLLFAQAGTNKTRTMKWVCNPARIGLWSSALKNIPCTIVIPGVMRGVGNLKWLPFQDFFLLSDFSN